MEDIKKVFDQTCIGNDFHYCQMDVDEIMRRVPGVSIEIDYFRSVENSVSILSSWV